MKKSIGRTGISLITLIVTIIVVIIIAGAVILSISKNNPIEEANQARLQTDMVAFTDALNMYHMKNSSETLGVYDSSKLSADEYGITYTGEGQVDTTGNIYTIFPNLKGKYDNKIEVKNGDLLFSGTTEKELIWARDVGVKISIFTIEDGVLKSTNASLSLVDNTGKLVIPENVEVIDSGAFHNVQSLREIVIPGNVKKINPSAFSNNSTLERVEMQYGIEEIGSFAFENCSMLKEVILPDSLKVLGDTTFKRCYKLENLVIPNSLTKLPYRMVAECTALKNITIPESIVTIENAFESCTALQSIYIPKNVNSISSGTFNGCRSLTTVDIDPLNPYFSFENGVLYNKNKTRLIFALTTITNITFPLTLTTISTSAFAGCNKLPAILTIPSIITSIEDNALIYSSIRKVDVVPENLKYSSENGVLYSKDKKRLMFVVPLTETYIVREGVERIACNTFQRASIVKEIILPESLKRLDSFSLTELTGIKKLNITKNINIIDQGVFPYNLEELTVDPSNTTFMSKNNMLFSKDEKKLVYGLKRYTNVIVPVGTEVLGVNCFYSTDVTNIQLPNTLKVIEQKSFDYCPKIQKIQIPSSVVTIAYDSFYRCNILNQIIIDKSKGSISGSPWSCPYGERAVIWGN